MINGSQQLLLTAEPHIMTTFLQEVVKCVYESMQANAACLGVAKSSFVVGSSASQSRKVYEDMQALVMMPQEQHVAALLTLQQVHQYLLT